MYVNVVFVMSCLYSAVSLTLVREQRFIRIIYYYYVRILSGRFETDSSCLLMRGHYLCQ